MARSRFSASSVNSLAVANAFSTFRGLTKLAILPRSVGDFAAQSLKARRALRGTIALRVDSPPISERPQEYEGPDEKRAAKNEGTSIFDLFRTWLLR